MHSRATHIDISKYLEDFEKGLRKRFVPGYISVRNDKIEHAIYTVAVPMESLARIKKNDGWLICTEDCRPTLVWGGDLPKQGVFRKGTEVEDPFPLIHVRFIGEDTTFDMAEDFKLLMNAVRDGKDYKIKDEDGDWRFVTETSSEGITIDLAFLMDFAQQRQCAVLYQYEYTIWSDRKLSEEMLSQSELKYDTKSSWYVGYSGNVGTDKNTSFSRLSGMRIVLPMERKDFLDRDECESFPVGLDERGNEILAPCDGRTSPYSEDIRPVHFKPSVLTKYFADKKSYIISDALIHRIGAWQLKVDNHHHDKVICLLYDLRSLPLKEQRHWRSYAYYGEGGLSETIWDRWFQCKWDAKIVRYDLVLESRFSRAAERIKSEFGINLWLPLSSAEAHLRNNLAVPPDNYPDLLDTQIKDTAKVFIDSLNKKALQKALGDAEEDTGSIQMLKSFEEKREIDDGIGPILSRIQKLRSSSSAHRKGKELSRILRQMGYDEDKLYQAFYDTIEHLSQRLRHYPNSEPKPVVWDVVTEEAGAP